MRYINLRFTYLLTYLLQPDVFRDTLRHFILQTKHYVIFSLQPMFNLNTKFGIKSLLILT